MPCDGPINLAIDDHKFAVPRMFGRSAATLFERVATFLRLLSQPLLSSLVTYLCHLSLLPSGRSSRLCAAANVPTTLSSLMSSRRSSPSDAPRALSFSKIASFSGRALHVPQEHLRDALLGFRRRPFP